MNKAVFIKFKIYANKLSALEENIQVHNYHKMKDEAILDHYKEKLKNQIKYTPEDRDRLSKKISLLIQLQKKHGE